MFVINEISIDNEMLISNVTLTMDDGAEIIVTVPVRLPQGKEDVIAAIKYREINEQKKHAAFPLLDAIKKELDEQVVGKAQGI